MFEEGNKMAEKYGAENVYDFSLGNPNVPAPKAVKEAIVSILESEDPVRLHAYKNLLLPDTIKPGQFFHQDICCRIRIQAKTVRIHLFNTFATPGAGGYGFSLVLSLITRSFGCSPGTYGSTFRILSKIA